MNYHLLLLSAALVTAASCKDKSSPTQPSGSATGSGTTSAADAGGAGPSPRTPLTAPHGIPLSGEALAKHYGECIASLNARNVEDVKQHCVDPEIAIHEVDFDDFQGVDVTLAYFESMRTAMPDWMIEPQLVLVSGRSIHAVNLVTGTHTGTLKLPDDRELAATNDKVGLLMYQHLQTNEDNKTVEEWDYLDHHTLQDQLGASPEGAAATRAARTDAWAGAPIVLVAKDTPEEQANLDLVTKLVASFNTRDAAAVASMFADDGVISDQADHEDHRGKAAITASLQALFTAFPDAKATVSHAAASGEYVFVEGSLSGTHKGALGALAATNQPIDVSYAEVFKIQDRKIRELWRFRDGMALTAQLMMPARDGRRTPSRDPKRGAKTK